MPTIEFKKGENNFNPVPEGTYDFEILEASPGTSSGGHMQIELNTQIVGGAEDGRKVRMWYVITEKSGWKIDKLLQAIGLDSAPTEGGNFAFDTDQMLGAVFTADASIAKTPDGRDKNEFKNERPSKLAAQPPAQDAAAPAAAPTAAQLAASTAAPAAAPGQAAAMPAFQGGARARRAG